MSKLAGIHRDLAAKASADFRRDHSQLVFRHAGDDRAEKTDDVRVLRGVPERELASRWNHLGNGRPRLHGGWNQSLLNDPFAHDDLCRRERGIDVTASDRPVKRLIARDVGVELGRARLGRAFGIDHRRQWLVLDLDEVEGILRLVTIFRHDNRHAITDVSDRVLRDASTRRP